MASPSFMKPRGSRSAQPDLPRALLVALAVLTMGALFAALLFVPAGRLDWPAGWAYVALVLVTVTVNWACLQRWNPELIARRMRFGAGTKRWDVVWSVLFTPVMLAIYVVAGLDARDGAATLPGWCWFAGVAVFAPGAVLLVASMVVNPFFEKTVRIQTDRGHRVIDSGPYAVVRHPGYAGFAGWIASAPLLLGSAWAFLPAALALAGLVVRTVLEDRTLRAELDGYDAYTRRVRWRWLPGVW
jgi:protein-S-isoprenylcysteine O-methyltransferase Ste14